MQEVIVKEVGLLGYAKELDPSFKDLLLNVLIARKARGTSVALSFRLLNKKQDVGGRKLRTQVPPAAVRIGVEKLWRIFESEINSGLDSAPTVSSRQLFKSGPSIRNSRPKLGQSRATPPSSGYSGWAPSARKKVCKNVSSHAAKSIAEIKQALIISAKKLALSEFFGEVISSRSKVSNFKLDYAIVSTGSFGIVRTKGSPRYFNGKSLGEICVEGEFFITATDMKRLQPRTVTQDNVCFSNENLSLRGLKERLRDRVITVLVTKASPSLGVVHARDLSSLVRNLKLASERYFVATSAVCADASAEIIPLEIEAFARNRSKVH